MEPKGHWHWGLVCSFEDVNPTKFAQMTLTYFMAKSNFIHNVFLREYMEMFIFFINAKAEIILLARNVEPNETQTMVLVSIKGQADLWPLTLGHSFWTATCLCKHLCSQITMSWLHSNFILGYSYMKQYRHDICFRSLDQKWLPHPYMHGWKFSGFILNSGFWGWLSTEMLNYADYNSFSDIFTVYLKTIKHLSLKYYYFEGILQVLKFEFQKFRILKKIGLSPMYCIW